MNIKRLSNKFIGKPFDDLIEGFNNVQIAIINAIGLINTQLLLGANCTDAQARKLIKTKMRLQGKLYQIGLEVDSINPLPGD